MCIRDRGETSQGFGHNLSQFVARYGALLLNAFVRQEHERHTVKPVSYTHLDVYKRQRYVSADYLNKMEEKTIAILQAFHQAQPLTAGMRREALRTTLLPRTEIALTDKLLNVFIQRGSLVDRDLSLIHICIRISAAHRHRRRSPPMWRRSFAATIRSNLT